ncbi:methyltransferase domain-containing protein [Bradyrhizobium sp.]|uniref:class I SAM-dependent methyltransferase n=1 Tax=Bradyrhizobium sp. TaxID=376 RepID=UPI00343D51A4
MQVLDRVASSYDQPVLDAPCGFGRNALALASRGYDVIAVDNDVARLKSVEVSGALQSTGSGRIVTLCADLVASRLPFRNSSFSAILCIHYPVQKVIVDLCTALKDGGWLYVETFGGQGQNYLELPKLGEIPEALQGFELVLCKERPVGPPSQRAAVVQLLAQKRGGADRKS